MFVGHYALGYLIKKKFSEVPLWLVFIAVQFVDILAFIFILLGIERISYNPSENPYLRMVLEYIPYTHSLIGNTFIAAVVLLIFWKLKNKVWGLVLGFGVLSHWFLDALVHTADLPIIMDKFKVGLGLWQSPWLAFLLELAFLYTAGYLFLKVFKKKTATFIIIGLLTLGSGLMFFSPEEEAPAAVVAIVSLSLFTIFALLAYWSERKKVR